MFVVAITSLLAGFAESGVLAIVAATASALVSDTGNVQLDLGPLSASPSVGHLLALGFALSVMRLVLQAILAHLPARIAAEVQAELRVSLFAAFSSASWDMQSRDREGHLQEMMTSQIMQATQGAGGAVALINSVLTFLVLVVAALVLNVLAAAVVLVTAGAIFLLLGPLNRLGSARARSLSASQMEYAGAVGEATRIAEETQVFGVAVAQRGRVGDFIDNSRELFAQTQSLLRLVPALYQSLLYLIVIGGLTALYLTSAGQVTTLGAVVLLLVRAGTYGQQIQTSYQTLRQSVPFIDRVREEESHYRDSKPSQGTRPMARIAELAFERVSFSYQPGVEVLSGVDFRVDGGETIGIVGPSGAGKSTLVQILLQLRSPTGGRCLVNGAPASEYRREEWRANVTYVPQEPNLIHASVSDNIRFFREIDEGAVERAARLAHIHEDIVSWSDGYETIIGPRADAVSGGQQQRICLARALAGRPQMLVLDEPTSSLDSRSEVLIRQSLAEIKEEMTLFIVAHRPAIIEICDRVMVVVGGQLEAFGPQASIPEAGASDPVAVERLPIASGGVRN